MKPRVLYLHGFASGPGSQKAQYFRRQFAANGIEIEIPDLAEGDFEHLTLSGQLRVIARAAAGQAVTLMGSSMGGYLAALYAARHPEVERMVLMAPAFGFARRWARTLGEETLARWRSTGFLEMYHYGEKRAAKVSYKLIEDGEGYEDYPDCKQPALIFHGRKDDAVPLAYSEEFAAAHPHTTLEVFDSDHELLDVLDRMWERVSRFVR
jgi:pimeloyl-ACP methyl ester carboxylesterase